MAKHIDEKDKEKFRPGARDAVDAQVDALFGGLTDEQLYGAEKLPEEGAMKKGRVVSLGDEEVFIDLGGKSQGVAALQQFENVPEIGEEFEFEIERYDGSEGLLILRRKGAAASDVSWETLEVGQIVEAAVTGVNKGGLELDVKGMRAFMPAGQVEIYHVPDLNQFINQKLTAEVTQVERAGRNIVLSRRNILERQREEQKKKLLEELAPEQIRRGTVRAIMDFGAFIDLGGVDGLLHVSELSFRRVRNAAEVVKVGDVLDVKVLKVDREAGKISLSLRQARGVDPWTTVGENYTAGTQLTGRVTKIETFGAFIEVEEGIEGLLPISEISHQRIKHPSDMLKVGDTIKLMVLSMDPVARRLSFSHRQALKEPEAAPAEANAPAPKKKKPQLRGGLDR